MSKRRTAAGTALVGVLVAGALAASQHSALADGAPQPKDVVGVGSDIMQNSVNFLADGHGADLGYNAAGNKYRIFSFDATGDANGRKPFTDPALGTPTQLNGTVTLRAGTSPVQRPNGGSAGLTALINDGKNGVSANKISFARSPNLPTAAQQTAAQQNLGSALHSVQIATDIDYIATATTTNAPANLTGDDLVKIYTGQYTTWGQIPGYAGPAPSATIKPLIPQNGAGMRTVFLNALKQFNGGAAVNPTAATEVQQNDPTSITSLPDAEKPNAIVPFPKGRFTLLDGGYFLNPNAPYSVAAPADPLTTTGIQLHTGAGAWSTTFAYYVIFRQADFDSNEVWQPGGTLNWVQTLFYNPGATPWVKSAPGQALLQSAGVTPAYVDRGNDVQ
ncbi:MAG: substrate-binding domain-containing protein [Nocardioidaceae bacterium]|nr:substrate-binding domain-containing protein [Nocardioidaceae bacterium]